MKKLNFVEKSQFRKGEYVIFSLSYGGIVYVRKNGKRWESYNRNTNVKGVFPYRSAKTLRELAEKVK
jgi:hypothetical protein